MVAKTDKSDRLLQHFDGQAASSLFVRGSPAPSLATDRGALGYHAARNACERNEKREPDVLAGRSTRHGVQPIGYDTAWTSAIVPYVFVSKISRTVSIDVASKALIKPIPALLAKTSIGPIATLVQLVAEESRSQRPTRDVVLAHRGSGFDRSATFAGTRASSGLVRDLTDERLAQVIRRLHENPAQPWTAAQLAKEAALSRSAFFERFNRAVGVAPMEYLLA